MPDITLTVDFTQVNSLNTTLKSTDTLFVKVVDSLLRESQRADRVTKAFANTTQENLDIINKAEAIVTAKLKQESDRREKLRVKETARAEKEAQKLVDANNKIIASEIKRRAEEDKKAATYAQNFQAQVGPNLGLGAQGISAGASASAFGDEAERLRLKYDQIYASSQLYEKSLAEINRAHMLGVTSVKQHESAVESLNQEYQNFQNGIRQVGNRFVQHSNQTSDGMNRMGVAAQQTGYQVSDFIVQVQGGTNPLVAFSQQMTQMAGLLYLLPPAIQAQTLPLLGFKIALSTAFAGVTILIPLLAALAMAFFNSGEEAKAAADGPIKDAEDRIRSLDSALKDYILTKKAASLGLTKDEISSTDSLVAALKALDDAEARLLEIKKNAKESAAAGASPGSAGVSLLLGRAEEVSQAEAIAAAEEKRAEAIERVRLVQERGVDTYNKQHDALYDIFDLELAKLNLGEDSLAFKEKEAEADRRNYAERLKSSGDLNDAQIADLVLIYQSQQDMLKVRQAELTEAEKLKQATADQLSIMGKTKQESDKFVASLKSAYGLLASSHAAASGIADQMTRAANAYVVSNSVGGASYMANQYSLYGEGRVSGEKLARESGELYGGVSVLPPPKSGAGAMTTAENKMEEIYKYLETDKYLIEQQTIAFEQRQAVLEDALKKKIVTLEEYNQIEKDLTNRHQTEIADIENKAKMAKISTVLGVGEQILTALGAHNEKAAKMARVFGAAQALADTYAGAAAALKLPFPQNLVAAGSIISAGLGFVNAIKSGSSTSTSGGRGSATVAASSNTAPAPQTVFIDSLDPDGLYSGQALISLFDAFYDENDRRGKVFLVGR